MKKRDNLIKIEGINDPTELNDRRVQVVSRILEIGGPYAIEINTAIANDNKDNENTKVSLHWDHLLKEMMWLSADFQKERNRHMNNGKKISKGIDSYHKTKEIKLVKKSKEDILLLKKQSSKISKEIRKFWFKIDKVITFKQRTEADEIRQKAMDKHLINLIKQTERYTNLLADNLRTGNQIDISLSKQNDNLINYKKRKILMQNSQNKKVKFDSFNITNDVTNTVIDKTINDNNLSENNNRTCNIDIKLDDINNDEILSDSYSNNDSDGSEEFIPNDDNDNLDDETTLIEAENNCDIDVNEEMLLLKKESEMSIEDLRALYSNMSDSPIHSDISERTILSEKISQSNNLSIDNLESDDCDNEFVLKDNESVDDETTLIEAEENDKDIPIEDEINLLKKESEMSIENLRAMYSNISENESSLNESYESDKMDSNSKTSDSDDDFIINEDELIDDETTLIEAEEQDQAESAENETDLLKKESEIPIDELRAMYNNIVDDESSIVESNSNDETSKISNVNDEDNDEDFIPNDSELFDDETTLIEAEENNRDIPVEEEINLLKKESEMSIDELRAMYKKMLDSNSDDESNGFASESFEETVSSGTKQSFDYNANKDDFDINNTSRKLLSNNLNISSDEEDTDTMSMDIDVDNEDNDDTSVDVSHALRRLEVADEKARSVHVELPFILAKNLVLREYQHVGVNWLVSLHERRLNGILADEMGLGKTIQTIVLLAYLACYRGLWGPHLVVVPTSCIINWETEFKKWCPGFKVLTYYGSAKVRKQLRTGWSKLNSFHICITSYQLVVQDAITFRRKRWYYMILDEAHNIKNFKSQRWQTLLNFNTQRRLLLTGTPLQNNLMELWSLMHFLMPHIFKSRKEFSYWFNNPLNNMIENNISSNQKSNNDVIAKLHGIMRPFLLRRLKSDVAKQLPKKYEHIIYCKLSKRQSYLYEEYMSRSSTKSSLNNSNYLGMMNILMQLRKVCNHPDLFEPRPIITPYVFDCINYSAIYLPLITKALEKHPLNFINIKNYFYWDLNIDSNSYNRITQLELPFHIFIDDLNIQKYNDNESNTNGYINSYKQLFYVKLYTAKSSKYKYNYNICHNNICKYILLNYSYDTINSCTLEPAFISRVHMPKYSKFITNTWSDLVLSTEQRIQKFVNIIENFIFILPKVIIRSMPTPIRLNIMNKELYGNFDQYKSYNRLLYPIIIRQSIHFPDKKLIQFDSGKLQALAKLLYQLKQNNSKCLIFTQMSKMLDILEIFLNLNGYIYVRLDGSTGVDKRQKLMDKFNNNPKIFCFILSTRSGGLGINLTGADTVIFYDSDWNPAMDAQAQDRAHRIGQTKEVHIYRLITLSTIEENILLKAKQKKQLDFLVMTEGNFSEDSLFTSKNIKDMLGLAQPINQNNIATTNNIQTDQPIKQTDVEAAMLAVEDDDDIKAMKLTKAEIDNENDEFSDNQNNIDGVQTNQSSGQLVNTVDTVDEEKSMEIEFANWQAKSGVTNDYHSLINILKPVERYALQFHSVIEPFNSIYFISESNRLNDVITESNQSNWNIDEIEREREEEEYKALSEGELLISNLSSYLQINKSKKWFLIERKKRLFKRKLSIINGEGWNEYINLYNNTLYWYNKDTGEISYQTPESIKFKEELIKANQLKFNGIPMKILIHILKFLNPMDRRIVNQVCKHWAEASKSNCFIFKVLPIELTNQADKLINKHIDSYNNYCIYTSINEAINKSLPGQLIILSTGHYWENNIIISQPLRIFGEIDNTRCIIELNGQLTINESAKFTVIANVTIRRARKVNRKVSCIVNRGSILYMYNSIISNDGAAGSCIVLSNNSCYYSYGCILNGATVAAISTYQSIIVLVNCQITLNQGNAITSYDSKLFINECNIYDNKKGSYIDITETTLSLRNSFIQSSITSTLLDDLSFIQCDNCNTEIENLEDHLSLLFPVLFKYYDESDESESIFENEDDYYMNDETN